MRIRWRGRTYILGRKAKAKYRAGILKQAQDIARIARLKPDATAPIDLQKELAEFWKAFSGPDSPFSRPGSSARDRIISVTSFLDEQLKWLIVTKLGRIPSNTEMGDIFEGYGLLGSFANRITLCSVFGILPDEIKGELRILKKIRNEIAAHEYGPLTFETPELVAECQNLRMTKIIKVDFGNEAEQCFVASSLWISLTLILCLQMTIQQSKILRDKFDEVNRNGVIFWNEIMTKAGLPTVEVPPEPSPNKSV